jgi:hypothetical protein
VWQNKSFWEKNRSGHQVRASVAWANYCGTAHKVASTPKSPKCSDLLRQLKTARRFISRYFCIKTVFVQLFIQSDCFFVSELALEVFIFIPPPEEKGCFFHIDSKPEMTLTPARFLYLCHFSIFLKISYNAPVSLTSDLFENFNKLVQILWNIFEISQTNLWTILVSINDSLNKQALQPLTRREGIHQRLLKETSHKHCSLQQTNSKETRLKASSLPRRSGRSPLQYAAAFSHEMQQRRWRIWV